MLGVMGNSDNIRRGRHAVWDCHAHLVFVTKYRRNVFTSEMLSSCEEAMQKVCDDFSVELVKFNGEDDYVHLLVRFPATVALSKLVNSLKGVSSRILRRDYSDYISQYLWNGHLWSRSYYCGTAGGAPLSVISEYVQSQRRSD